MNNINTVMETSLSDLYANLFGQEIRYSREDGIKGISIELAKALMRAGMYHTSWALEILADNNLMGKVLTKKEFTGVMRRYMGIKSKAIRIAFDELRGLDNTGYVHKGTYKRSVMEYRKKVMDFLPKIGQDLTRKESRNPRTNLGKKSGKGRPEALIYVPTELELELELHGIGLSWDRSAHAGYIYTVKPFDVMSNIPLYKAFIVMDRVSRDGKGEYSRRELASPCGVSISVVRSYAQRMQYQVITNPPQLSRIPIDPKNINQLPVNEFALKKEIQKCRLPAGIHIRNERNKYYDYTQEGAKMAWEYSRKIFAAVFVKSTYIPTDNRNFLR